MCKCWNVKLRHVLHSITRDDVCHILVSYSCPHVIYLERNCVRTARYEVAMSAWTRHPPPAGAGTPDLLTWSYISISPPSLSFSFCYPYIYFFIHIAFFKGLTRARHDSPARGTSRWRRQENLVTDWSLLLQALRSVFVSVRIIARALKWSPVVRSLCDRRFPAAVGLRRRSSSELFLCSQFDSSTVTQRQLCFRWERLGS